MIYGLSLGFGRVKNIFGQVKYVQQACSLKMIYGNDRIKKVHAWRKLRLDRDLASAQAAALIRMAIVLVRAFIFTAGTLLLLIKMHDLCCRANKQRDHGKP